MIYLHETHHVITHVPILSAQAKRNLSQNKWQWHTLDIDNAVDQKLHQKFHTYFKLRNKITKKLQSSWFLSSHTQENFAPPYTSQIWRKTDLLWAPLLYAISFRLHAWSARMIIGEEDA